VGVLVAQRTATPALLELSFQRLVAMPAAPRGLNVRIGVQNFFNPCARPRKLPIVHDLELRPAFDKRQFPRAPGEQFVLDKAVKSFLLKGLF